MVVNTIVPLPNVPVPPVNIPTPPAPTLPLPPVPGLPEAPGAGGIPASPDTVPATPGAPTVGGTPTGGRTNSHRRRADHAQRRRAADSRRTQWLRGPPPQRVLRDNGDERRVRYWRRWLRRRAGSDHRCPGWSGRITLDRWCGSAGHGRGARADRDALGTPALLAVLLFSVVSAGLVRTTMLSRRTASPAHTAPTDSRGRQPPAHSYSASPVRPDVVGLQRTRRAGRLLSYDIRTLADSMS